MINGLELTDGSSKTANEVKDCVGSVFVHLRESASGSERTLIDRQLDTMCLELSHAGWDGYDAEPVQRRAVEQAKVLIDTLPYGCPLPEVTPDPDGEISLDWFRDHDWQVSISVGSDCMLAYGARFGRSDVYGAEYWPTYGFPPELANKLLRLYGS